MDLPTTYKIFLVKTIKEKLYYWTRNVFFTVFPLLFIIVYFFSGAAEQSGAHQNRSSQTYETTTEVSFRAPPKRLR